MKSSRKAYAAHRLPVVSYRDKTLWLLTNLRTKRVMSL